MKNQKLKRVLLNFHIFDKIPMHKQLKRVLNHRQILRVAVGFSGKSHKIVTQKSVHALDGIVCAFLTRCFDGSIRLQVCQ